MSVNSASSSEDSQENTLSSRLEVTPRSSLAVTPSSSLEADLNFEASEDAYVLPEAAVPNKLNPSDDDDDDDFYEPALTRTYRWPWQDPELAVIPRPSLKRYAFGRMLLREMKRNFVKFPKYACRMPP